MGHKDLLAWSCHSIRVTAANLLHRACFSDSYIKNRLRWRSDTFLMYLHNTFYTADQHTKAITLGLNPPNRNVSRPLEPHESLLRKRVTTSQMSSKTNYASHFKSILHHLHTSLHIWHHD
jgi:hypothetical protein